MLGAGNVYKIMFKPSKCSFLENFRNLRPQPRLGEKISVQEVLVLIFLIDSDDEQVLR